MSEELKTIRMLRHALAAIWTAIEYEAAWHTQTIADEALRLSVKFASPGKDLTDDSTGFESWRIHVNPDGEIVKEFW